MTSDTAKLLGDTIIALIVGIGIGYSIGKSAWQSDKAKALEAEVLNKKKLSKGIKK